MLAGSASAIVMPAKHVLRAALENNDQAPWICAVRSVSLNAGCVVYPICQGGRSYLAESESDRLFTPGKVGGALCDLAKARS